MHSHWTKEVEIILHHIQGYSNPWITREYAYKNGIDYYNDGNYFEAHEIWEFQWKKERGEIKIYLQALIQIAVCLNKIHNIPNTKGAISLASKAGGKLEYLLTTDSFTPIGMDLLQKLKRFTKHVLHHDENLSLLRTIPIPDLGKGKLEDLLKE